MRMKRLLAAMAGLAVIGGIWISIHDAVPPERRSQGLVGPGQAPGAPPGAAALRRPSTQLPEGPFHAVRPELESRARSGDAEAAYRMGDVIGHCLEYERVPMDRLVTLIASAAAYAFRVAGHPIDSDISVDAMLERKQELDELCEGTEDLATTARAGDAHAWLLRAAALGHTGAMAHYPDHAFAEFKTHADLLDNAEEVARRRDRGRALIERAFEAGDPEALYAYAKAHAGNGILDKDPTRALAYWSAYRHSTATSEAIGKLGDAELRAQLSRSQAQEADLMATRILDRFHHADEGR